MNTVYKCIASVATKPDKSYIGLSEDEWKKPYYLLCNLHETMGKPYLNFHFKFQDFLHEITQI